jgi:hypothetical protein
MRGDAGAGLEQHLEALVDQPLRHLGVVATRRSPATVSFGIPTAGDEPAHTEADQRDGVRLAERGVDLRPELFGEPRQTITTVIRRQRRRQTPMTMRLQVRLHGLELAAGVEDAVDEDDAHDGLDRAGLAGCNGGGHHVLLHPAPGRPVSDEVLRLVLRRDLHSLEAGGPEHRM